jgi:hypothetical protein
MLKVSQKSSTISLERRALRVLMMVHELHKAGCQKIRIFPGMSPSGAYWRCGIAAARYAEPGDGARLAQWDRGVHYTTGARNEYFEWKDAKSDTARELAGKFQSRFPAIVKEGEGDDLPYAGWLVKVIGYAEHGAFPIAYADWAFEEDTTHRLPLTGSGVAELGINWVEAPPLPVLKSFVT